MQAESYMKISEVANLLNLSTRTIHNWIGSGRIPAVKLSKRTIRIPKDQFYQSLSKSEQNSAK